MRRNITHSVHVLALIALLGVRGLSAAQLPILVTANAGQAAAGAGNIGLIHVYLATGQGAPKLDAEVSTAQSILPPTWTFLTLVVPVTFDGPCTQQVRGATQTVNVPGQLRVQRVFKLFAGPNEPTAGLYTFEVAPVVQCGAGTAALRWTSGEYHFLVSYSNGVDRGTALGVLVVR